MNTILKFTGLTTLLVAVVLATGCAGPIGKTSKYMNASLTTLASPPPGKTLVCIHRPRSNAAHIYYAGIWEDTKFIADLGSGHSVACVCEPGKHYFMSLFPGVSPSCVEAQLLPDQTCDLWINASGVFPNFRLEPLPQNDKTRKQVAKWNMNNRWVTPASSAADYEQRKQEKIRQLLEEFISGKRHDSLQHMAAEDHR